MQRHRIKWQIPSNNENQCHHTDCIAYGCIRTCMCLHKKRWKHLTAAIKLPCYTKFHKNMQIPISVGEIVVKSDRDNVLYSGWLCECVFVFQMPFKEWNPTHISFCLLRLVFIESTRSYLPEEQCIWFRCTTSNSHRQIVHHNCIG